MGMRLSPTVRNILILCIGMFVLQQMFTEPFFIPGKGYLKISVISKYLALHDFKYSEYFMPHQFFTYIFLHGSISHIFFNMFALVMFGTMLEDFLGQKRFLLLFLVSGIGAGLFYSIIQYLRISPEEGELLIQYRQYNVFGMLGASGSVFGILFGAGYYFPNTRVMLLFPPIPMKLKHMVIVYGALELLMELGNRPGDNVAHLAHLGGMLFSFILVMIWKNQDKNKNWR